MRFTGSAIIMSKGEAKCLLAHTWRHAPDDLLGIFLDFEGRRIYATDGVRALIAHDPTVGAGDPPGKMVLLPRAVLEAAAKHHGCRFAPGAAGAIEWEVFGKAAFLALCEDRTAVIEAFGTVLPVTDAIRQAPALWRAIPTTPGGVAQTLITEQVGSLGLLAGAGVSQITLQLGKANDPCMVTGVSDNADATGWLILIVPARRTL